MGVGVHVGQRVHGEGDVVAKLIRRRGSTRPPRSSRSPTTTTWVTPRVRRVASVCIAPVRHQRTDASRNSSKPAPPGAALVRFPRPVSPLPTTAGSPAVGTHRPEPGPLDSSAGWRAAADALQAVVGEPGLGSSAGRPESRTASRPGPRLDPRAAGRPTPDGERRRLGAANRSRPWWAGSAAGPGRVPARRRRAPRGRRRRRRSGRPAGLRWRVVDLVRGTLRLGLEDDPAGGSVGQDHPSAGPKDATQLVGRRSRVEVGPAQTDQVRPARPAARGSARLRPVRWPATSVRSRPCQPRARRASDGIARPIRPGSRRRPGRPSSPERPATPRQRRRLARGHPARHRSGHGRARSRRSRRSAPA